LAGQLPGFFPTEPGTSGVTDSRSWVKALKGMAYGLNGREEHDRLGLVAGIQVGHNVGGDVWTIGGEVRLAGRLEVC
jgi:hypothetical protein